MPSSPFVYPQPLNVTPLAASGNSTALNLPPKSQYMSATFHIKFTVGSLTNATFKVQALNPDGSTWGDVVGATTGALTVSGNYAITVSAPGVKQLRLAYASTGTVTSSAAVVDVTTQAA